MILKRVLGISASALLMASGSAFSREFADIYTDCGLGAMIAPSNDAVAAVTNVTWDLGTTAISSDASSEENCKGGQAAAASFIHETYATLENDLARGEGEHVSALYDMLGCSGESRGQLTDALRGDFSGLINSSDYAGGSRFEKSASLYDMVNDRVNSDFASSCNIS